MARIIEAQITGTVLKIMKNAGESISAGDTILVLESMKMEIPIEAKNAGILSSIQVMEGQAVREGEAVALLE